MTIVKSKTEVRAWRLPWLDQIELSIFNVDLEKKRIFVLGGDAAGYSEQEHLPGSAILTPTMAQSLMDNLWSCGVRPTEGRGSAGSFEAQGRHLEDMRKLVFERIVPPEASPKF